MITRTHALPVIRQCQLLELARSTAYAQPRPVSASVLALMRRMSLAGMGFTVQRFDAHASHQGAYSLTPDPVAFAPQQVAQHSGSGKWRGQMELVDPAHQREIR